MKAAISEVESVADGVIARLEASMVKDLKAKGEDGKLSAEDATEVLDTAVEMVISDLSVSTINLIQDNADDIAAYIANQIEKQLTRADA